MKLTHLEFSFQLATCNLGSRTRTFANPFSGKSESAPIDDGLNLEECKALRDLIQSAGFTQSEIPGEGWELALSQDEILRLRGDIEVGCSGFAVEIVVKSLTDRVLDLVLSAARAGNFALTSVTGEDVRLVHPPTNELVAARWPNAPLVSTRDDLRHWLEKVIRPRRVHGGQHES